MVFKADTLGVNVGDLRVVRWPACEAIGAHMCIRKNAKGVLDIVSCGTTVVVLEWALPTYVVRVLHNGASLAVHCSHLKER